MTLNQNGELGLTATGFICINPGTGRLTINEIDLVKTLSRTLGLEPDDFMGLRFSGRLSLAIERTDLVEIENHLTEEVDDETV